MTMRRAPERTTDSHRARGRQERTLRIIAGVWRGRRFRFPALEIRPTPDRVRETLFNWLRDRIEGARCLDLYAGSGALGLEALSRGAAEVVFVEQQRSVAEAITKLLADWRAGGASVVCTEARAYLAGRAVAAQAGARAAFDLVFLDPPFGSGEIARSAAALAEGGWLTPQARIYVEHARAEPLPPLPPAWHQLKSGTAGEVGYHLYAPAGEGGTVPA